MVNWVGIGVSIVVVYWKREDSNRFGKGVTDLVPLEEAYFRRGMGKVSTNSQLVIFFKR
jgi:hypothetical protein